MKNRLLEKLTMGMLGREVHVAKIIIIEGVDGAGKTTLARELERLGARYVHHGPPKKGEDLFSMYVKALHGAHADTAPPKAGAAPQKNQTPAVVFDRLHLGELVYGEAVRKRSQLGVMGIDLIDRYAHARGAITVIALPPWRVVEKSWLARDGEYVKDIKQLYAIYAAYADLLFRDRRPYLHWDYTRWPAASVARALLTVEPTVLPPGLVGSPCPQFLFVGERANMRRSAGGLDIPFMSLKGASAYLYQALRDAGFSEGECAFMNALDADGAPNPDPIVTSELEQQIGPRTIALGRVAHRWLCDHGIGHHELPHPQHQKRFKSANYVAALRKIRRGS